MERPRCEATAKGGARCRGWALPGRPWCFAHDPAAANALRAARVRGAKAAAAARRLRRQRPDLTDPAALARFMADLALDVLTGRVPVEAARAATYAVATLRQVLETSDLARRVTALEKSIMEEQK